MLQVTCTAPAEARAHLRACQQVAATPGHPLLGYADAVHATLAPLFCCQWCDIRFANAEALALHLSRHLSYYNVPASLGTKCATCANTDFSATDDEGRIALAKHMYDYHYQHLKTHHLATKAEAWHRDWECAAQPTDLTAVEAGRYIVVTQWLNAATEPPVQVTSVMLPFVCSCCQEKVSCETCPCCY